MTPDYFLTTDTEVLTQQAGALRDQSHGRLISYSRKVFIPLTKLCRDVCHYCTFAHPPRKGERAYLTAEEVLAIAKAGQTAGCKEALFTLGDKPEARYNVAKVELAELGHETTLSYLAEMAELVFRETGLLPHLNPGVMNTAELNALRAVSVSQGIMLESTSERLCEKGGPHWGSPDKNPAVRLQTIKEAGQLAIPFTSGILIGIGETRTERLEALIALRGLHIKYGHIQEIIIQNFRAKPDTKMAAAAEPNLDELLWTIASARLLFGAEMNIQAPPNLSPGVLPKLIEAGINDWGGVSPVTPDHVNPEAPWPHLDKLAQETALAGKDLTERLALYPDYVQSAEKWTTLELSPAVMRMSDSEGFARTEDWTPGAKAKPPVMPSVGNGPNSALEPILARASAGETLTKHEIVQLFGARGDAFHQVCEAADQLRQKTLGDTVTYAVNRNINYTNVCSYRCQFCAFSKGKLSENLRGRPYDLDLEEIRRRVQEAWDRGATEICMQGGIHPDYTGATYLKLCETAKSVAPDIHIHAFTPLEVSQGASTLGIAIKDFLTQLKAAGLGTLPGTAAEILDDEVRAIICPDKVTTAEWLEVMEIAHGLGLNSTATIMFGHVDRPIHWARHLHRVRELQQRTGGFTELVPLPFVPMEAPIYLKGRARFGPTFREAVLMHAVSRLALNPVIRNIQTSWVKMGVDGMKACLKAGANDVGGTLMNETITRSAGAEHGQEMPPEQLEKIISDLGRLPQQRTTLYQPVTTERHATALTARPLAPTVNAPATKYARTSGRALSAAE
jgi:FO synthase